MRGDRWWPTALVGVLLITVGANAAVFWAATRGEGPAVEPDYYRRAVAWDSTLAERDRSAALGWRLEAALSTPEDGRSRLEIVVADAGGGPVARARGRVEGFAIAHSSRRLDALLTEPAPGRYVTTLAVARIEWHELQLTLERDDQRFLARLRCLPGGECRAR